MLWNKAPVFRIGDSLDHAMVVDGTGSETTGFVQITVHTSAVTHRAVPVSDEDFTLLCIQWLVHKDVIEANPDKPDIQDADVIDEDRAIEYVNDLPLMADAPNWPSYPYLGIGGPDS